MKESNPPHEGRPQEWDDLQVWKVSPEIPPRFQAEVWKKIAARQAPPSLWERFLELATFSVARPQFAAALILGAGIAGGGLAQLKAQQANERSFNAMQSQYIASIDPYAHIAHIAHQAETRME